MLLELSLSLGFIGFAAAQTEPQTDPSVGCADDPDWVDEFGTTTCYTISHNQWWCDDFGDYSKAARENCPVACGLCDHSHQECLCAGVNNGMGVGAKCDSERLYDGKMWCYVDLDTCPNAFRSEQQAIQEQNLGFIYCEESHVEVGEIFCRDACETANNGICEDGHSGSVDDSCPFGTDCGDCGPRQLGPGPDGTKTETRRREYLTVEDCEADINMLADDVTRENFPTRPSDDPRCDEQEDGSTSVLTVCEAFGYVTKRVYSDISCGQDGGAREKERKWDRLFLDECVEEETETGVTVVARYNWEGFCTPPGDGTLCFDQIGKGKYRNNVVKSSKIRDVFSDCACSDVCLVSSTADNNPYTHSEWNAADNTCQCFRGDVKKIKGSKTDIYHNVLANA